MKTNEYILEDLSIQCGIPQGSLLSPILFLSYNADLLDICSSITPKLSASAFIDDTSLLAIGLSTKENCLNLAKAHKKCLEWAETHGAVFAPSKYQSLHLTRQKKKKVLPDFGNTTFTLKNYKSLYHRAVTLSNS